MYVYKYICSDTYDTLYIILCITVNNCGTIWVIKEHLGVLIRNILQRNISIRRGEREQAISYKIF